jgi:hypothetical protein
LKLLGIFRIGKKEGYKTGLTKGIVGRGGSALQPKNVRNKVVSTSSRIDPIEKQIKDPREIVTGSSPITLHDIKRRINYEGEMYLQSNASHSRIRNTITNTSELLMETW